MAKSPGTRRLSHQQAFQKLVRELRLSKGLSQEDLAEKIGFHAGSISALEGGRRFPSVDTLFAVFGGLDTNPAIAFEAIQWCSRMRIHDEVSLDELKKLLTAPPQPKRARKSAHTGKFISR
jgi:transcriptional regulator with XRE-family HTH domain